MHVCYTLDVCTHNVFTVVNVTGGLKQQQLLPVGLNGLIYLICFNFQSKATQAQCCCFD